MAPLRISLGPEASGAGIVTLSCEAGCNRVRFYASPDRTNPETLPLMWELVGPSLDAILLYVEGVEVSLTGQDVTLKAVFNDGGSTCQDIVKLTVYHIKEVAWETAKDSGNLALDDDTVNNGGKRIFPGKLDPTDG